MGEATNTFTGMRGHQLARRIVYLERLGLPLRRADRVAGRYQSAARRELLGILTEEIWAYRAGKKRRPRPTKLEIQARRTAQLAVAAS